MVNKAIDLLYVAKQNGIEIVLHEEQLQLKLPRDKAIDKNLLEEIRNNKSLIIDFLRSHQRSNHNNKINKFARESIDRIPLSFSQEGLWFIDQLEGSIQYHIPVVLKLRGYLDQNALSFALQTIVNRHEVLRTVIKEQDGTPYQFVREPDNWNLMIVDGSEYQENSQALQLYIEQLICKSFDLSRDDMIRATLIVFNNKKNILVLTLHHIAADGWSESILFKELVELYNSYIENRPATLSLPELQYSDYVIWQRQFLQGELLEKKMNYWMNKLDDVVPLDLQTDFPRPAVQSTKGAIVRFFIDKEVSEELVRLSHKQGTTLFMVLLAAFKILLYRYSGQDDICVGTPVAGRHQHEVENLIGFFINILALRSEVKADISFTELLQQVKTTTLEAYEHQDIPFEKVVNSIARKRNITRSTLFNVMLVLQNIPDVPQLRLGEVEVSEENNDHTTAKFDITFIIAETALGLQGSVEYSTDLYTGETIRRMIKHYTELLSSLVRHPDQKIEKLAMLTRAEEHQLLIEFNNTAVPYSKNKTITELFEAQVAATPGKVAVVAEWEQLTYQQLNARANQLAHYLRERGVAPGHNVGLLSYRGLEMIVGMIGILKAGAAYVPLNTAYPSGRLKYIVEDAAIMHIVYSDEQLLKAAGLESYNCIAVQESLGSITGPTGLITAAGDRVYIMYTSGTTGRPKGIAVSHRNVTKLVFESGPIAVQPGDRMLQWSNYAFDGSVYEIYSALLLGASLHLIRDDWASDVHELSRVIKRQGVTVCFLTTALFNTFVDTDATVFRGLRKVLFGGEMVSLPHVRKALDIAGGSRIVHVYGPTETTVYATFYPISDIGTDGVIPIGKPLDNTWLRVLGKNMELLPVGVPGELYIGGDGVSPGYFNQPELTAGKFIDDPFSKEPGTRLYRTGDMVRWLADGSLEYLGRMDYQVKIRGYHIEPAEIENVLCESGSVKQAVVLVTEGGSGNKRLVAYVVPGRTYDKQAITSYLREKLPDYMVPELWVELENLPVTPNGKIDKKSLPDPVSGTDNEYTEPGSDAEKALAEIWQELLKLDKVSVNDNFFELGGHSLIFTQMLDRVRKLGYEIKAKDLFPYQTIRQQSKFLSTSLMLFNESRKGKFVIPIHEGGANIPLFALPDYIIFCKLASYIKKDQPFYSIEKSSHNSDFEAAMHYIGEIKKAYPHGPYCLVGFCRWAGIALEMAHQLTAQGEEVPVLVLIEYYPPGSRYSRTSMKYINIGTRRFYKQLSENQTLREKVKFIYNQIRQFGNFISKKIIKRPAAETLYLPAHVKSYPGKVVLFSASEKLFGFKDHVEIGLFQLFTGSVETFTIDGDHLGIFSKHGSMQMGEKLNAIMEDVNKTYKLKQPPIANALSYAG